MNIKHIIIYIILLLGSLQLIAQSYSYSIIALPHNDSVFVRWAPKDYNTWQKGIRNGYFIEKVTMFQGGVILSNDNLKREILGPFVPANMVELERLSETDNYVQVAAEAMYSKTFEISSSGGYGSPVEMFNIATEQTNRYSFALYAADISYTAALASGLGFIDANVSKDERYAYRLYLNNHDTIKTDTAFVFVAPDLQPPLPKPFLHSIESNDKMAVITWLPTESRIGFTAYNIYRSDDNGNSYSKVNKLPVINTNVENKRLKSYYYIDTLPQNNHQYLYYVKGITPFGIEGSPSDTMDATGKSRLKAVPYITFHEPVESGVLLKWGFNEHELKKVKAFQVVRGTTDKGPFEPVSKELDIDVYEYYDLMPIPTAYYKVRAIDKHGSMAYSVPVLTQLTDSIPPSPPTGLKGIVDSLGIVKVTWNANEEDDIYGYRIYRANAAHEEYSQLTVAPVLENQFTDTISLKTLTKNIFYKVMAIDKRQNYSKFSKPVKIQRPDIVPPSAPRIVNMDQQTDKVCFRVIPSASSDVKEYILQRKENNEDNWNIVERYNTPIDSLVCNMDIPQKGKYSYTLQAIDSSGLFSEVTQELSVVFNESNCLQINNLQAKSNPSEQHVKLSWELPACANTYVIYKGTQQRPLTMYKRTDNNTPEFIDKQVSPGDSLNYVIKAISISNSQGNAKQIEILY